VLKLESDGTSLVGAELHAKSILKSMGLSAGKIATNSKKSADFVISSESPPYLIEVKSRLLDERISRPTQPIGEPVTKPMRRDPKVGAWLAESKKQFASLDPQHDHLWFLWCSMESPFGALDQMERTASVLYGVQEAFDVQAPERTVVVFYAMPAAFDDFPDIDGALLVLADLPAITFCPNEASPRFEAVMQSRLVCALRKDEIGPILPRERAAAWSCPRKIGQGQQVAV
jgi:hypothetical protein